MRHYRGLLEAWDPNSERMLSGIPNPVPNLGNWKRGQSCCRMMARTQSTDAYEEICCLPHPGWLVHELRCSCVRSRGQQREIASSRVSEGGQEAAEGFEEIHKSATEGAAQNGEARSQEHTLSKKKLLNRRRRHLFVGSLSPRRSSHRPPRHLRHKTPRPGLE